MIAILNSSLQVTDRFTPETQSLDLEERKSVSVVTTGMEMPDIACGTWLRDETNPGKGIIWRVRSNEKQFDRKTKTLQLEHVINTLRDVLIFGELTPAMIAGGNATTCTARQAAQKVLSYQNIWVLGDFEFNVSNPYSFNGEDCFSAMETITSSLEGAYWEYDLTRLPFRLHVRKLPEDVSCEMRMNRNIQTIRMTVDRSRMFTRFYPIGNDNLTLPGGYVSRNENLYGVISKTETDQSRKTVGELQAWANERLRNHSEPSVTVQISGMEWSQVTGEPLDSLQINKRCRVPLPEYGTFIREKVTKLRWANKIAEPEKVTVTLANLIADVASILNSASKSSARAGRTSAKKAEEDHAWFEDTTDHVAMVAEAVAGEGAAEDWSRVAAIVVDGNGIHQRVTKTEGDIVTAQTAIEANENAITLEAQRAAGAEGALAGRITVEADRITQEVTRASSAEGALAGRITVEADRITQEVSRATAAEGSLSGMITVEAGKINQIVSAVGKDGKVTAASVVLAVNSAGSTVAIAADHVSIDGDTKLSGTMTIDNGALVVKKSAVFQGNVTLTDANGYVQAKNFNVASGGALKFIGTQTGEQYSLTASNIQGFIKEASVDGNVLTLTPVHGDPITFSKAVSLSGAWNSNVYTVTASPQGTTISTSIGSRFGANQGNYYIEAYRSADSGAPGISGASITYQLANNAGTVELQDTNGSRIADTPTYAIPLQEKTVTSNGTVTPDSGYVGLSSVVVNVPTSTGGNKARFNSGDGQYFIEAYDNASGTSVAGSSLAYLLAAKYISGSGIEVQIQDTDGTKLGNTRTCPIWLLSSQSGVNNQGTLAYDTYYGISSGSTILATWKTPAAPTHSPSIDSVWTSDRTPSGGTQLNSLKTQYENAKSDGDFFCIRVDCYGTKKTYYCEP